MKLIMKDSEEKNMGFIKYFFNFIYILMQHNRDQTFRHAQSLKFIEKLHFFVVVVVSPLCYIKIEKHSKNLRCMHFTDIMFPKIENECLFRIRAPFCRICQLLLSKNNFVSIIANTVFKDFITKLKE